jgi:YVTN family beta-propeller protein
MKRAQIVVWAAVLAGLPAFSLAAQLLVLNKSDATLSFIDPTSGKTAGTVPTGEGPHEVELSADHRFAYVSNYGASASNPGSTLSIIDVAARKEVKRVELGGLRRPHGLAFSKGHLYFTAEANQKIGRYDPDAQRVDWTFETGQEGTHMVLASGDGSKLFATNMGSKSVSLIEMGPKGEGKQTLVGVGEGPEALDLSPDGRTLWTAHSRDGGISIIDTASGKVLHRLDMKTKRSNRLKFTKDGSWVLVSDLGAGELLVIDPKTRAERTRLQLGNGPTGILIVPDGQHAYVALSGENRIAVIDLKSMTVAKSIATGNQPDGMAWAP